MDLKDEMDKRDDAPLYSVHFVHGVHAACSVWLISVEKGAGAPERKLRAIVAA